MSDLDENEVLEDSEEEGQKDKNRAENEKSKDQIKPSPLTQDMIREGLSLLCHTVDGLSHAFVKLELKMRSLTDIALLRSFVHLRYLDISSNYLTDLSPLASLTQLLWINGDFNQLEGFKSLPLAQLSYLQWLSLMSNRLTDMEGLEGSSLVTLNLIGNDIQRVSGLENQRLNNLVTLELRGNSLETTDGLYLPNLSCLYLAKNKINRLEGLDKLERLKTLHLRDNHLETFDGISANMKSLHYINVRSNLVSSEEALRPLMAIANTLRILVLSENSLTENEDYRLNVLILLPFLERLDKDPVSAEERADAQDALKEDSLTED